MKYEMFDSYEEFHKFQLAATNDVVPLIIIVESLHIRNKEISSMKKIIGKETLHTELQRMYQMILIKTAKSHLSL